MSYKCLFWLAAQGEQLFTRQVGDTKRELSAACCLLFWPHPSLPLQGLLVLLLLFPFFFSLSLKRSGAKTSSRKVSCGVKTTSCIKWSRIKTEILCSQHPFLRGRGLGRHHVGSLTQGPLLKSTWLPQVGFVLSTWARFADMMLWHVYFSTIK